jgi:hypothetical protein
MIKCYDNSLQYFIALAYRAVGDIKRPLFVDTAKELYGGLDRLLVCLKKHLPALLNRFGAFLLGLFQAYG